LELSDDPILYFLPADNNATKYNSIYNNNLIRGADSLMLVNESNPFLEHWGCSMSKPIKSLPD